MFSNDGSTFYVASVGWGFSTNLATPPTEVLHPCAQSVIYSSDLTGTTTYALSSAPSKSGTLSFTANGIPPFGDPYTDYSSFSFTADPATMKNFDLS